MPQPKKVSRSFHVNDLVQFIVGKYTLVGKIIEDRGPIGADGRRLYRIETETGPEGTAVIELPANDLHALEPLMPPSSTEIVRYLARGGLISILRQNQSGGKHQPRAWICRDSLGNVIHTYMPERGIVGGDTIPFNAIHEHDRIFKPKLPEVRDFIKTFGLSEDECLSVIEQVGTSP